ncbi:MAG: nucleotidyltransferase domain-containing protein [Janthinobacterium lividum]
MEKLRRANLHVMAVTLDPVLTRFRVALDAAYGDRIERVVLFGSRARGDARPDSDYDVAVFLRDIGGVGEEIARLVDLGDDILMDTGAFISAVALPEGAHRDRTGFMAEVRREGIDL